MNRILLRIVGRQYHWKRNLKSVLRSLAQTQSLNFPLENFLALQSGSGFPPNDTWMEEAFTCIVFYYETIIITPKRGYGICKGYLPTACCGCWEDTWTLLQKGACITLGGKGGHVVNDFHFPVHAFLAPNLHQCV